MAKCNDMNCTVHKALLPRGRTFQGVVVSDKMHKTATIEWERRKYVQKYERYEKKRTRVQAHNPDCIGAKQGDIVRIKECRPLSKTKKFVILEKLEEGMITEKVVKKNKKEKPAKKSGENREEK